MENIKKNVEHFNSGAAKHPLAPAFEPVKQQIEHFNSGTAKLPHHKKQ